VAETTYFTSADPVDPLSGGAPYIDGTAVAFPGPYRWMNHPNYAAVTAEVAALPLVHTARLTAIVFSVANALVLNVRIRDENAALGYV
jgi:methyltransferase